MSIIFWLCCKDRYNHKNHYTKLIANNEDEAIDALIDYANTNCYGSGYGIKPSRKIRDEIRQKTKVTRGDYTFYILQGEDNGFIESTEDDWIEPKELDTDESDNDSDNKD